MTDVSETHVAVLEIVRADYASLSTIIARIESYRDVMRAAALAFSTAAIGVAVTSKAVAPAFGALALVAFFGWGDVRFDYQYDVAHRRSRELEVLIQAYVTRLLETGRDLESDAQKRLDDLLAQYSFGSNLNVMRPSGRKVYRAKAHQPVNWSTGLYGALLTILICVVTLALIARD